MQENVKSVLQRAEDFSRQGRFSEAYDLCCQVLNANPNVDKALVILGNVAAANGHHGLAVNNYRQALAANGQNITAMVNLAPALYRAGRRDEALEVYRILEQVLSDPDASPDIVRDLYPQVCGNWAGLFVNVGAPAQGIPIADKGLKIDPDALLCHQHKALMLMEQGKWSEAWPHWQRRLTDPRFHTRNFNVPYWDGTETDCLAIHGEQGIGDEVMFASCVEDAKKFAKKVVIECQDRLIPVFERSFGVKCYPSPDALFAAHGHELTAKIAFGSLMTLFRKSSEDCPGHAYLTPNPSYLAEYKARLSSLGSGLKVGITWRGGTEKTHEKVRKVPLSNWAPILNVPNIKFVSIQYGPDAAVEADQNGVTHWSQANIDIDRQMALIAACDLVISVCQSAIHFAGSLGKETWCLTPSAPRWCYALKGETMSFYNSVRLIRQTSDWKEVIRSVAGELTFRAQREAA